MGKFNFKNISIKWQLMIICILLISVPVLTLGVTSYKTSEKETFAQIEDRLSQQVLELDLFVKSVYNEVESARIAADRQAEAVVGEQAKVVYELVQNQPNVELLKNAISRITVGDTGYIWVVDYDGNYVVSKGRTRDGENIWGAKDSEGVLFIQEAIRKAKKLSENNVDYQVYPWLNTGETEARDKIAGLLHVPELGWVIGVSTYFDELVDTNFEEEKIGHLKDELASIVVGKTGYIYILDEEGNYVLSLNRGRDGENIWGAKDANGVSFVQEIIAGGKNLGEGETGVQYYPWKNAGENTARLKLAAYSFVHEYDWVLASSAYQGDFLDGLNAIGRNTFIVSIVSIIVGSIIAYLFALYIVSSLNVLVKNMKTVADGDLTLKFTKSECTNELCQIGNSFGDMLGNLKTLVMTIKNTTEKTASSSEELSASSEEVNSSMEQVSATIQEIAKSAESLSKQSETIAADSKGAADSARKGSESTGEVTDKMSQISSSTKEGSVKIKALGEKSKEIGNIVQTINGISEQTNLLALNAAIEAARAGDAGRGFAVVADEVRKLAEETGNATKQISELVTNIQGDIQGSVDTMETNTTQVDEGSAAIKTALASFDEIPKLVDMINKSLNELSSVAQQNSAGSEEVTSSVQQVTSAMQQVASSAQELSASASELTTAVSKFKIDGDDSPSSKHEQLTEDEIGQYEKEAEKHMK